MARLGRRRRRILKRKFERNVARQVKAGVDERQAAEAVYADMILENDFEDRPILRLIVQFLTMLLSDLLDDLLNPDD